MCRMGSKDLTICPILGVNIVVTDIDKTVLFLKKNLTALSGSYICVSNVHTTIMSYDDPEYQKIQNQAVMALPDGGPLSYIQKNKGFLNAARVTGPDLMERILQISAKNGYKHYFYGSTNETLNQLKIFIEKNHPGTQLVGTASPPFHPLSNEEDLASIKHINEANADFIWVGLGAPKQELWMAAHEGKVTGLMIGVGAGFDYLAGNLKRAPGWMQHMNLEWFYRLIQDPKRLFKRYFITNTRFLFLMVKEKYKRHELRG